MIVARNLTRRFDGRAVVESLSLHIEEGEAVGLLGPNGAGKTTTVRLLTGVLRRDGGELSVLGRDPAKDGEAVRASCGVLTESAAFYAHMSGLENLRFFAALVGVTDEQRPLELLERMGIADAMNRPVGTWSTGMRKRLGLARALLHRPRLLFLDEPTNGLDPEGIRDVLQLLARLNAEEKVTLVLCSHLLQQLELVCRRYLFIDRGRLVEEGTLDELRERYRGPSQVLEVETPMLPEALPGITASVLAPGRLAVQVRDRDEVPEMLRQLTQRGPVYGASLQTESLERLYFQILERHGQSLKRDGRDAERGDHA